MLTRRADDPEVLAEIGDYRLAMFATLLPAVPPTVIPGPQRDRFLEAFAADSIACTILVLTKAGRHLRQFLCASDGFPLQKYLRENAAGILEHLIELDGADALPPDDSHRI